MLLIGSSSSSVTHWEFRSPNQVLSWHPGPTARLMQAVEHGACASNTPQQSHINSGCLGSLVEILYPQRQQSHNFSAFPFQSRTTSINFFLITRSSLPCCDLCPLLLALSSSLRQHRSKCPGPEPGQPRPPGFPDGSRPQARWDACPVAHSHHE